VSVALIDPGLIVDDMMPGWKPLTIWASGLSIDLVRYALSAVTVWPVVSVTLDPATPLSGGPIPVWPEIEWHAVQPFELNSVLPLDTCAADGAAAPGVVLVVAVLVVVGDGVVEVVCVAGGVVAVLGGVVGAVAAPVAVVPLLPPPHAARTITSASPASSASGRMVFFTSTKAVFSDAARGETTHQDSWRRNDPLACLFDERRPELACRQCDSYAVLPETPLPLSLHCS
jgi:hypothetical protein